MHLKLQFRSRCLTPAHRHTTFGPGPHPQGLDILTPLGRGASLLVIGPAGSGKTQLGLDAVLAQVGVGRGEGV